MKIIGFVTILSLLSGSCLNAQKWPGDRHRADGFEERDYRFDGKKWVSIWLQCDAADEVVLISQPDSADRVHYETYKKKSPSQRTIAYFLRSDAIGSSYILAPFPSRSQTQMDKYWIRDVASDKGGWLRNLAIMTNLNQCDCQWFPQTRFAGITERRSVFVTVNNLGKLDYRSFNFSESQPGQWPTNQIKPSVLLQGGFVKLDSAAGVETFTFVKEEYAYVVEVGLPDKSPSAHIVVQKNNVEVQRERCQSFAYAWKAPILHLTPRRRVISNGWISYNGPDFTFKYPGTMSVSENEGGVAINPLGIHISVANDDKPWEYTNAGCPDLMQVKVIGGIPAQSYCNYEGAAGTINYTYGYRLRKQEMTWVFELVVEYHTADFASLENVEEYRLAFEDLEKMIDERIILFSNLLSTFKFIK